MKSSTKKIILSTLCENTAGNMGVDAIAEWGFSALIETGDNTFLFDTGSWHNSCVYNAKMVLNKNLAAIDKIILSHGHMDHTGGLLSVLQAINDPFAREVRKVEVITHPDVYKSKCIKIANRNIYIGIPHQKELLQSYGAAFELTSKPTWLSENIVTTGEIEMSTSYESIEKHFVLQESNKFIQDPVADDQGLIIKTSKGIVVITGCAHRGLINMLLHAQKITSEKRIYMILGGTHLINASLERVNQTIEALKKLKVQKIGVSHCTGATASALLAYEFGNNFFINCAGTCIVIDE
jgi:7,8-dihydropterin-6-yl-methyl-4-(beta-D-ribofuranosyl)aminobenzene 5'-phosphate synthase